MNQLWKKNVALFLSSQAISLFGSSIVQFAIIWYITLKTGSGMMMTLSTLCGFVPQVIISLFAGVWADHYSKKKMIMLADSLIALSTLGIAILFFLGYDSIWLLFAVLAIRSFGSGVQTPTVTSFVPEITPSEHLMKVNGLNTTMQSIMLVVSPIVSGGLLANVSLPYILLIDMVTALIGVSVLSMVKVTDTKKEETVGNYFTAMKEGIVYIRSHPFIARMLFYVFLANFLVTPLGIMTPLFVTRQFGPDPWYLTMNEIVFFVGNILGGILISAWGGFKNRIHTVGLGCIICGVLCVLVGFPFSLVFYLLCMGLIGLVVPFFNTPFITMFQENVDSEKQGRVFSIISIITGTVIPISMLLYGPLADCLDMKYIFIVTGLLFLIWSFILVKDKVINGICKE